MSSLYEQQAHLNQRLAEMEEEIELRMCVLLSHAALAGTANLIPLSTAQQG